jgi:hypothetical protein
MKDSPTTKKYKLVCPVCNQDEFTYLRCYRPDCVDGRITRKVEVNEKEKD